RVAQALGTERIPAADGIHRVINTVMAEGIRVVSVRRGVDPRRFALLAFGGAAGLHVTDVARRLEIRRVVVPRVAAVLSAWGMLATDLRYEAVRTHIGDARRVGAVGELPALPEEPALPARLPAAPRGRRRVYFGMAGGWYDVPVYDLDVLAPGQAVTGPALFEAATTTVLVGTDERAVVTPLGWL